MVEYITARTTSNGARAEHLTMERELQIADLSQRLDRAEKRPGSDRVEWQWPGVLCPTPNPSTPPSTPNLCPHSHPDALPPAYLLSPLVARNPVHWICIVLDPGGT